MLDVTARRIGIVSARAVGLAWGLLSLVSFAQPDPFHPVRFIDYLAVVSFSVALAILAPAAWLVATVAGRSIGLQRRATVSTLAAVSIVGALTFLEGGLGLIVAALLVTGVAAWRGLDTVVRATAIILAVGAPIAAFGNLIEDGLQMKDVGGALFAAGLGGTIIGLLGLAIAMSFAGRFALAGLCAATLVGSAAATQYGGGLLVLVVWLFFADRIGRAGPGATSGDTRPDVP